MKVLILTSSLDPATGGGWARYSRELIRHLLRLGVEVEIFVEGSQAIVTPYFENARVHNGLRVTSNASLMNVFRLIRDYFLIRPYGKDFDIVHALVEHHVFLAALLRRPFLVTAHGTYFPRFFRQAIYGFFTQYALRASRGVIFGSEFTEKKVKEAVPMIRTFFIPNAVDTQVFKPSSVRHISSTFITVGALKPRKGQDLCIKALASIADQYPEANYKMIGDLSGSFTRQLKLLAQQLNITERVEFVSSASDTRLVEYYNSALALLLPSRTDKAGAFEGFPLSLLEAAACGIPVVGTYGCGAEHLIKNGLNGFLIQPEDEAALAERMVYFLEDLERAATMGREAREAAAAFSWEKHASSVVRVYNRTVDTVAQISLEDSTTS